MSTDRKQQVMRPGKTRDDRLPVDQRQRVKAWRERSEAQRKKAVDNPEGGE